jgi:hypothetical protein
MAERRDDTVPRVSDEDATRPSAGGDVVLVGPPLGEGGSDGFAVLRRRADQLELGAIRELREGRPIDGGELVRLKPRREHGRLFDVEVLAELPRPGGGGPPQVATEAYRTGWEAIFGELEAPVDDGELN